MKVVINRCFGGFVLSAQAQRRLEALRGDANGRWRDLRSDPRLVQVVEELGEKASGEHSKLSVVEVPDDVAWSIEEYDGNEWVAEVHRTWP